jgi:hypothetical protein
VLADEINLWGLNAHYLRDNQARFRFSINQKKPSMSTKEDEYFSGTSLDVAEQYSSNPPATGPPKVGTGSGSGTGPQGKSNEASNSTGNGSGSKSKGKDGSVRSVS